MGSKRIELTAHNFTLLYDKHMESMPSLLTKLERDFISSHIQLIERFLFHLRANTKDMKIKNPNGRSVENGTNNYVDV